MFNKPKEKTAVQELEEFISDPLEYKGMPPEQALKTVVHDADEVATQLLEAKRVLTWIAANEVGDNPTAQLEEIIAKAQESVTARDFRVYKHSIQEL